MKRLCIILWTSIASLTLTAQETRTFALDASAIQLGSDYPTAQVRIPVTRLTTGTGDPPAIRITSVRFGNRFDQKLHRAFRESRWEDSTLQAIILTVDTSTVTENGIYEVSLLIESSKADVKPELLKVQIISPDARLRTVEKLLIERVWNFFGVATVQRVPLPLQETSRMSPLTDLAIRPSRMSTFGNKQVSADLMFFIDQSGVALEETNAVIGPGKQLTLDYALAGTFPLGTVSGAFEVDAPQLSAPLNVPFEVTSRLARWYIFVFLAVGLLASYLVKVRLQQAINLGQARASGIEVYQRAQAELARRDDATFRNALDSHHKNLQSSLVGSDPTAISKAATDLDTALRDALAELASRRKTVQSRIDEFLTLTENHWPVPKAIDSALNQAKTSVDQAGNALGNDNIDDATRFLAAARASIVRALGEALPTWQRDVRACLDVLATTSAGLSARLRAEFANSLEAVRSTLGTTLLDDSAVSVAALIQLFPKIVKERRSVEDAVTRLARALEGEMATLMDLLSKFKLPDKNSVDQLRSRVQRLAQSVKTIVYQPGDILDRLSSELGEVQEAWRIALGRQVSPTAIATIDRLVAEGKYSEATQNVMTVLHQDQADVALGDVEAAVATVFPEFGRGPDLLPSLAAYRTATMVPAEMPPLEVLRLQSLADVRSAKRWQTLIVGILVAFGGYIAQRQHFIGDFTDFATIFFWAFGIDMTLDTVLKFTVPKRT